MCIRDRAVALLAVILLKKRRMKDR
jgi:hypothetical protein